jgi:hypothetical protein
MTLGPKFIKIFNLLKERTERAIRETTRLENSLFALLDKSLEMMKPFGWLLFLCSFFTMNRYSMGGLTNS